MGESTYQLVIRILQTSTVGMCFPSKIGELTSWISLADQGEVGTYSGC